MKPNPQRIGSEKIMPQARRLKTALFKLLRAGSGGLESFASHIQRHASDYSLRHVHDALAGIRPSEFPERGLLLEHALTHLLWEQVASEIKLTPREAGVLRRYYLAKSQYGSYRPETLFDDQTETEKKITLEKQKELEQLRDQARLMVVMQKKKGQILKKAGIIRLRLKNAVTRRGIENRMEPFSFSVMLKSLGVFSKSLETLREMDKLYRRGRLPISTPARVRKSTAR